MSLRASKPAPTSAPPPRARLDAVLRAGIERVREQGAETGPPAEQNPTFPRNGGDMNGSEQARRAAVERRAAYGEEVRRNVQRNLERARARTAQRQQAVQALKDEAERLSALAPYQGARQEPPPPRPEDERAIEQVEAEAQTILAEQQQLSEETMELMQELNASVRANSENMRDLDRVIREAELERKTLYAKLMSLGEQESDMRGLIETHIVALSSVIKESEATFQTFLVENNKTLVNDIKEALEQRLSELLTQECGDKIERQTGMIARLQQDLKNLSSADGRAMTAMEQRLAERQEAHMRKTIEELQETNRTLKLSLTEGKLSNLQRMIVNADMPNFVQQLVNAVKTLDVDAARDLLEWGVDVNIRAYANQTGRGYNNSIVKHDFPLLEILNKTIDNVKYDAFRTSKPYQWGWLRDGASFSADKTMAIKAMFELLVYGKHGEKLLSEFTLTTPVNIGIAPVRKQKFHLSSIDVTVFMLDRFYRNEPDRLEFLMSNWLRATDSSQLDWYLPSFDDHLLARAIVRMPNVDGYTRSLRSYLTKFLDRAQTQRGKKDKADLVRLVNDTKETSVRELQVRLYDELIADLKDAIAEDAA